jgi:hypothetical protein
MVARGQQHQTPQKKEKAKLDLFKDANSKVIYGKVFETCKEEYVIFCLQISLPNKDIRTSLSPPLQLHNCIYGFLETT